MGLKIYPGSFGVTGSKGHFYQKCYFSYRLHVMVMWLMYIDQLYTFYKSYGSRNSVRVIWGHWGQKVIFTKKCYFSFRLHGMVIGLMHIHQLDTLYKSYGSRNSPGVIWGHSVKKSFSPKMLFLLQITWYGHGTHAYSSARYFYKIIGSRNSVGGHLGSQGSKGHFHKKCYFSFI